MEAMWEGDVMDNAENDEFSPSLAPFAGDINIVSLFLVGITTLWIL